jgi:septal ring factor EnvC (AmiA/AmiB activator)
METHQQIETLKFKIAQQEAELADLETEILDIEQEMKAFTERYNRLIKPLQDKLDLINDMIADLEKERYSPPASPQPGSRWTTWTPPDDYVSVEEQYRRAWQVPKQERAGFDESFQALPTSETRPDDVKVELKKLYRKLARRFHPDLATEPDERERRNRLMAEINAAYSDRDLDALRLLAAQPEDARIDEPIAVLHLRQLQQINQQLARRIGELRFQRSEMFNGEMMSLKIQASLASHRKRDLLQEMADQLELDYRASLDRLDKLREA